MAYCDRCRGYCSEKPAESLLVDKSINEKAIVVQLQLITRCEKCSLVMRNKFHYVEFELPNYNGQELSTAVKIVPLLKETEYYYPTRGRNKGQPVPKNYLFSYEVLIKAKAINEEGTASGTLLLNESKKISVKSQEFSKIAREETTKEEDANVSAVQ